MFQLLYNWKIWLKIPEIFWIKITEMLQKKLPKSKKQKTLKEL